MTSKTTISSQGRTVIPVEIRKKLGICEGETVEWILESGVIIVRPVRNRKTPDEIMRYLKDHLVEIKVIGSKVVSVGQKKKAMDRWARGKLELTP